MEPEAIANNIASLIAHGLNDQEILSYNPKTYTPNMVMLELMSVIRHLMTKSNHTEWQEKVISENPYIVVTAMNEIRMFGSYDACVKDCELLEKQRRIAKIYRRVDHDERASDESKWD